MRQSHLPSLTIKGTAPCRQDRPPWSLPHRQDYVDRIPSGQLDPNADFTWRTPHRQCHTAQACHRYRGVVPKALKPGLTPPKRRELL